MLKTAHLYPYWQYQQVQRSSKREAHSPFHGMILRYDDPFWSTGTPPNGWGCQCYRSQLTQAEWDVYVSNVTGNKIEKGKENAYANTPVLFSTLRQEAADAIGEDVKLMVTDKQIIHANRTRINENGSIKGYAGTRIQTGTFHDIAKLMRYTSQPY